MCTENRHYVESVGWVEGQCEAHQLMELGTEAAEPVKEVEYASCATGGADAESRVYVERLAYAEPSSPLVRRPLEDDWYDGDSDG